MSGNKLDGIELMLEEINECIDKINKFLKTVEAVKQFMSKTFEYAKPKSIEEALLEEMLAVMFKSMGMNSSDAEAAVRTMKKILPKEVIYGVADDKRRILPKVVVYGEDKKTAENSSN